MLLSFVKKRLIVHDKEWHHSITIAWENTTKERIQRKLEEVILHIEVMLKDEFIAKVTKVEKDLELSFTNNQTFRISVEEV